MEHPSGDAKDFGGPLATQKPEKSNPVIVPRETVRCVCRQKDIVNTSELHLTLTAFAGHMKQNSNMKNKRDEVITAIRVEIV